MAAIQPISKIVNKQTKIMSTSLKRMSDMGTKNGKDMFDVIEVQYSSPRTCNWSNTNNLINNIIILPGGGAI